MFVYHYIYISSYCSLMEGCTSVWPTDSLGKVMLNEHINSPLWSWCNVLQALHDDSWLQVQKISYCELHRPHVGDQKEVPLRTVRWVLSDLLSTYSPVLPPSYGILRNLYKIVNYAFSPETTDLLHTVIWCYRITDTAFNKYESCVVSKGGVCYKM